MTADKPVPPPRPKPFNCRKCGLKILNYPCTGCGTHPTSPPPPKAGETGQQYKERTSACDDGIIDCTPDMGRKLEALGKAMQDGNTGILTLLTLAIDAGVDLRFGGPSQY